MILMFEDISSLNLVLAGSKIKIYIMVPLLELCSNFNFIYFFKIELKLADFGDNFHETVGLIERQLICIRS